MRTGAKLSIVTAACVASAAVLFHNKDSKNSLAEAIDRSASAQTIVAQNFNAEKGNALVLDSSSSNDEVLSNNAAAQATALKTQTAAGLAKKLESNDIHLKPLTTPEIQSITNISKALSQTIGQGLNSDKFMRLIKTLGLQPKYMDEGNNALGSMVTVRTQNSLEGTRYLHAQFIGEKKNADLVEHVSFQIRPGTDSFEKAVGILNQVLPKNKTVKENGPGYVLYNTADGYVAWVKVSTTRDDLKTNKYNASSKEDIGTVIVTIEQEIHDMDHEGHNH